MARTDDWLENCTTSPECAGSSVRIEMGALESAVAGPDVITIDDERSEP